MKYKWNKYKYYKDLNPFKQFQVIVIRKINGNLMARFDGTKMIII